MVHHADVNHPVIERGAHRIVDTGNSVERGVEWASVERLIELARRAHRTELGPARRARIREQMLLRWERERNRRRTARAFVAGASTVLLAGLLLRLVSGGLPWIGQPSPPLARTPAAQHAMAE